MEIRIDVMYPVCVPPALRFGRCEVGIIGIRFRSGNKSQSILKPGGISFLSFLEAGCISPVCIQLATHIADSCTNLHIVALLSIPSSPNDS